MNNDRLLAIVARTLCIGKMFPRQITTPSTTRHLFLLMIMSLSISYAHSQCSLKCTNQVNVSLDQSCMATITPTMLINPATTSCPGGMYSLVLTDSNGIDRPNNMVGLSDINQTFEAEVTDTNSGNACWGRVTIEYKLAPNIMCPDSDTVSCGALDVLGLPVATAQCGGGTFEVFLLDEIREPLSCDPDYTTRITRTYRSENSFGNTAECTHTILLERIDFDGIIFPADACIACDDPNFTFVDGIPLPFISGVIPTGSGSAGVPIICMPTTGSGTMGTPNNIGFAFAACGSGSSGVPLIPIGGATIATPSGVDTIPTSLGQVCNSVVLFEDFPVSNNPCKRSIMRRFEVREWFCGGDSSRFGTQMIEVKDTTAPTFICPQDFTVSSDEYCQMIVDFPSVVATDGCGNGIIVKIDPDGSPLVEGNGGSGMLQTGINKVTYIVSDSCYNSSLCMLNVTVQDNVEPVAICESHTTVALSTAGNTFLKAASLDDGSWDGCGIDRFEVRRMTTDCNQDDTMFGDRVEFCCTDAGAEVMVVFRVYDTSGNTNDCMVRVDIQDKRPATLECPLSINIDCRDAFDTDNLAATFGEAKLVGGCTATNDVVEVPDLQVNQCNIGTITRTFNLLADDNVTVLSTCQQSINITNTSPFVASMIEWPQDFTSNAGLCSVDQVNPEDLDPPFAYPSFVSGNDQCSMLGFSHEDRIVTSTLSGQCFRIERTWAVINWCDDTGSSFAQFTDPNGPQIIDVRNAAAPTTNAFDPIVVESQNIDCTSGLIEYVRTGSGVCPGPLDWSYIVYDLGGTQVASGDTNVFIQVLAAAQYDVEWTITDNCNNTIVQNQMLTVINNKAPTPVCMNDLIVELDTPIDTDGDGINDQEIKELWASDFDGGSYQSCNNPITVSLSPDPTETNITFTCDSIGMRTLRLYVTDNVTMAQDYCSFSVTVTDGGMCGDNLRVIVEGDIYTENYENVEDVEVTLMNGNTVDMTDTDGHYAFDDMPMGGQYMIDPIKDVDYLNGVSTLDLVYIQRHILNIEQLDSPYKIIAADANNSQTVTAIDLIELRKLILGVQDELPLNNSWRFVDADHQFLDALDPWVSDMPEDYFISRLEGDMKIDFIGVKIGDVNGSVVPNLQSRAIDNRSSRWALSFTTEDKVINGGQSDYISFYSDSYERVSGWQMTLEYDADNIDVLSIYSDVLDIDESHYNIASQDQGWITISYSAEEPLDIDPSEPIFKVGVRAQDQVTSGDILSITSKVTHAEAYRGLNEIVDVQLRTQELLSTNIITARPNPWKDHTDIEFTIPVDGECKWEIFDLSGQLIHSYTARYNAGNNTYSIDRSHVSTAGVYYVKLTNKEQSADYKLVVIE